MSNLNTEIGHMRRAAEYALARSEAHDCSTHLVARDILLLLGEVDELQAERERLRAALEPFAKAADIRLCGEWRDDEGFGRTDVAFHLTFGDLRKARTALTPPAAASSGETK